MCLVLITLTRKIIMKVTTPEGIKIEGTCELVAKTIKLLGLNFNSRGLLVEDDSDVYTSGSKGIIPLSDMDNNHLRNAFIKEVRENTNWMAKYSCDELFSHNIELFDTVDDMYSFFSDFGQSVKLLKEMSNR